MFAFKRIKNELVKSSHWLVDWKTSTMTTTLIFIDSEEEPVSNLQKNKRTLIICAYIRTIHGTNCGFGAERILSLSFLRIFSCLFAVTQAVNTTQSFTAGHTQFSSKTDNILWDFYTLYKSLNAHFYALLLRYLLAMYSHRHE